MLGAGLRTGTKIQAAALPVGAGTRTLVADPETVADAGENLVPEPALQVQAPAAGQMLASVGLFAVTVVSGGGHDASSGDVRRGKRRPNQ